MNLAFIVVIQLCLLVCVSQAATPRYCEQFPVDPSAPPKPRLPKEFKVRVEATLSTQKKTIEVEEFYASYDNKAAVLLNDENQKLHLQFDYKENRLLVITDSDCQAQKLNETTDATFFGIRFDRDGSEKIAGPSSVLHFDNGFNQIYKGDTVIRGIPVSFWQSCQDWPELNANFLVNYYFTKSDYNMSVSWDDGPNTIFEFPVAAVITGISDISIEDGSYRNFSHEYNFFDFETRIVDKLATFSHPTGKFCSNIDATKYVPQIPNRFQFVFETVHKNGEVVKSSIVYYDYDQRIFRIDSKGVQHVHHFKIGDPVTIIEDFNSGVSYVINRMLHNCTLLPINEKNFGQFSTHNVFDAISYQKYSTRIKTPQEFFFFDSNFYYAGEKYHRGILCDTFIAKFNNITIGALSEPHDVVFEWFFMSKLWADETATKPENFVPIALLIHVPKLDIVITNNVYAFDSDHIDRSLFDVETCFNEKEKSRFSVSFNYDNSTGRNSFNQIFKIAVQELFLATTVDLMSDYSFSPLRLLPPYLESRANDFVVHTGVLDFAPPTKQFTRTYTVDANKINKEFSVKATSFEDCAATCVNSSQLVHDKFKCLSFDICYNRDGAKTVCAFYNSTHTEAHVAQVDVDESNTDYCHHYSKNSDNFDGVSKDVFLLQIKNAVLQNRFKVILEVNEDTQLEFNPKDLTQGLTRRKHSGDDKYNSYLRQFQLNNFTAGYKVEEIGQYRNISLRARTDVSLIECSRFCIDEYAFQCLSFTFNPLNMECKWASIGQNSVSLMKVDDDSARDLWYTRKHLYNYVEYSYKVSSNKVQTYFEKVESEDNCAYICNTYDKFVCRSFDYCAFQQTCYISGNHVNNPDKDPNIIPNPNCKHFSKKTLNDFKLYAKLKVSTFSVKSKYVNVSAERCAEYCVNEESYLCRSFDYTIKDSNCLLYDANLVDRIYYKIQTEFSEDTNHYSRTYYTKNGITYTINPINKSNVAKYSTGSMFGIIVAITIGFFMVGLMAGFIIEKKFKKSSVSVELKFKNPNYLNTN